MKGWSSWQPMKWLSTQDCTQFIGMPPSIHIRSTDHYVWHAGHFEARPYSYTEARPSTHWSSGRIDTKWKHSWIMWRGKHNYRPRSRSDGGAECKKSIPPNHSPDGSELQLPQPGHLSHSIIGSSCLSQRHSHPAIRFATISQ